MDAIMGSVLGWLGTIGTFTAYLMIWRGWMSPTAVLYGALNAAGGLLAGAGALAFGAWPAFISNLVWALLGLHSLVTGLLRRRREARDGVAPQVLGAQALATQPLTAQPLAAQSLDVPVFDDLPHLDDESLLTAITRPLAIVPAAPRRARETHHSMLVPQ